MNGVHDLGGLENLGPVVPEANEPVFHDAWERRVFALLNVMAASGYFNIDEVRRTIEWIPPADYLTYSYYEKWIWGLEAILLEKGVVTRAELAAGRSLGKGVAHPAIPAAGLRAALVQPLRMDVPATTGPRFRVGDEIVARNMHPRHHTRIPRYVRGRRGRVIELHEAYHLPDANAHGDHSRIEHCYTVEFTARELWGADAPAHDKVALNMFDSYMDPAGAAA